MKTIKFFLLMSAVVNLMLFSGCDGEDTLDLKDEYLNKITGTWNMETVKVDGTVITDAFTGMTLTLEKDMSYATTKGMSPIWPSSGNFTIEEAGQAYSMKRDDGTTITIHESTETSLVLKFTYTSANGRANSVSGPYEFYFTR